MEPPPPALDINQALTVLCDMPRLLMEATPTERKQVINIVFNRVWVRGKTIAAITPHNIYLTLLTAMKAANCVIGVADGTRTRNNRIHRAALCH